jgi:hypothetical protein
MQFTTEKNFCSRMGIYAYLKNDKKTIYFTAIVANKKQFRLPGMFFFR